MPNYYNIVEGNLKTGAIAMSSDIINIQENIMDMINAVISDQYDHESFMLGSGEKHKNDFLLIPAQKYQGRYVDDRIVPEDNHIDETNFINFNRYTVRQPLTLTKTSVYSVIVWLKNDSGRNIEVDFELQNLDGVPIRSNTLTIPKGTTTPKDFEVVFDLDYYPTALNLNHDDLDKRDGKDIPSRDTDEEAYDEGYSEDEDEEDTMSQFSAGVSQLYFTIKKTDLNEEKLQDLDPNNNDPTDFNPDTSLGVFFTKVSPNAEKNIYCETSNDEEFYSNSQKVNIYFKEIYANETTYTCKGGEAVIGGEKVLCLDSHVSVEGGNSYGNTLTSVYMDVDGHLKSRNYQSSLTTDIDEFVEDLDDPIDGEFFPVGLIFTYSSIYGVDRDPIVIQEQKYGQLPLNHHERLRRVEKKQDWIEDFSMPARLKYTLTGTDMIDSLDSEESNPIGYPFSKSKEDQEKSTYYLTTDAKGNPTVRLSESVINTIDITLKEDFKDSFGNPLSLTDEDERNASYFAKKENIVHDAKKGTITLDKKESDSKTGIGMTDKAAKKTELNPWDDAKENRPSSSKIKKKERKFTVHSGKNGKGDKTSEYPAMTFYTKSNYKMTKLNIPIHKFQDCSGIKFFIWKRQDKNNKKNTVWLKKKLYTSKEFSLKKAKKKGKYQYMDDGFTINFKDGLSLPKGQYVIICLPIPKSKEGSCFVDTYAPKDPKDFLIRYHGTANASHFTLKERYQEIWYNSASAEVIEEEYQKKGTITSRAITWKDEGLKKIQTIKPVIGKIDKPDKTKYKIYADTGGGWKELTPNKDNEITGGATTFKWKMEFTSDGKSTPTLSYDETKKYAIEFILTRAKSSGSSSQQSSEIDKSLCLTSVPLDGDQILREYVGDPNLALTHSKFDQHEFARIWADPIENTKLLIDIQGSDRDFTFTRTGKTYPFWTLHYCDLTLEDFNQMSVDYSHYDEDVEYDENNLRLKLDTEHSYNDNDISIAGLQEFKKVPNAIDSSTDSKEMVFVNNENVTENQVFLRSTFENLKDLSKYTGLTFKFKMKGSDASEIKGLGIYISSGENVTPTRATELDFAEVLEDTDILPKTIDPDKSSAPFYDGEILKIIHFVDKNGDGNKAYADGYYRYVQKYDSSSGKLIYVLEQVHDIKNYKIYTIGNLVYDQEKVVSDKTSATTEASSSATTGTGTSTTTGTGTSSTTGTGTSTTTGTGTSTTTESGSSSNTGSGTAPGVGDIVIDNQDGNSGTETDDSSKTEEYVEITVRIELDSTSPILQNVKEIGIVSLNDETEDEFKYSVVSTAAKVSLELEDVRALSEDYYPIFDPSRDKGLWKSDETHCEIYDCDSITITKDTYDKGLDDTNTITKEIKKMKSTTPYTTQICLNYQGLNKRETQLCYINNPYQGGLSRYKHVGIQIASDVYIPKDCIKVKLCEDVNGEEPFLSVNLPTLNSVYDPVGTSTYVSAINLSQVFKKINSDKEIKSISICATKYFADLIPKVVSEDKGDYINLFLGKIVVYKAETIPMFHQKMRYKLYSTTDGEIDHSKSDVLNKTINIRKLGTIIDYT